MVARRAVVQAVLGGAALLGACSGKSVAEKDAGEPMDGAPSGAGKGALPSNGGSQSAAGGAGGGLGRSGSTSAGTGGSADGAGRAGSSSLDAGGEEALAGAPASNDDEGSAAGAGGTSTEGNEDVGRCTVLTAEQRSYGARLVRTLLPPAGGIMGLASDAGSLWLSSGSHNAPTVSLIRYAIGTGKVMSTFATPALFTELGTGPYGIETAGSELLVSVSGNENQIVRIDRESGAIVGSWGSPTELGPSDLAWLGDELLVSTGTGKLYAANFEPPASVRPFTIFVPDNGRDAGVATCNGVVVWGGLFAGMTVLSPSGGVLGSIEREDHAFGQEELGPLAFYGDQLVIASTAGLDFYALEPAR